MKGESRMLLRKAKRASCVIWILLLSLVFPANGLPGETAPPEVVQAAVDGLGSFLNAISTGDIRHYGFSNKEEMLNATIGEPFKVYTITPDKVVSYSRGMELLSLISPTNQWFFPVFYLGEVRTILTVDLMGGEWKAVAIGRSGLAKELIMVANRWPQSEGYDLKFVRIYQAKADFVVLSKDGSSKMVPLTSAVLALRSAKMDARTGSLYDPSEILPRLIPAVYENLKSKR